MASASAERRDMRETTGARTTTTGRAVAVLAILGAVILGLAFTVRLLSPAIPPAAPSPEGHFSSGCGLCHSTSRSAPDQSK